MSHIHASLVQARVVEDDVELSLVELCRACHVREEQVRLWVVEGVLDVTRDAPEQAPSEWRFKGPALMRARTAQRLTRDLELDSAAVALALDLLDEIAELQARLRRAGAI
ncbi:MAG TPA: chaperone modulator CbpM [Burkholderiaceae bacterium]|nr:chaperone modulator CbpM [Burkholderiaceae bacterium]